MQPHEVPTPEDWVKGQLLNVRNYGREGFVITTLEEDYDYRHPERAVKFQHAYDCQQFVSWWYAPVQGPTP
jgi:hypothetical protein